MIMTDGSMYRENSQRQKHDYRHAINDEEMESHYKLNEKINWDSNWQVDERFRPPDVFVDENDFEDTRT